MSIVRVLVLAHLGLSAVLLLVLACVMLCQRLTGWARPSAARTPLPGGAPYPGDEPVLVPVQEVPALELAPRRAAPRSAASVLDWTVDLSADARGAAAARLVADVERSAAPGAGARPALQPSS